MLTPEVDLPAESNRPGAAAPLLLMLSASAAHVAEARRVAAAWPQPGHVVWAADPAHALCLAMAGAPTLALVDVGRDGGAGWALAQQIARWQPETDVITFADQPGDARVRPWSELRSALDWWWQHGRPSSTGGFDGGRP